LGDKTEKNEMGRACSAYEGQERHIQGIGGGKPKGKSYHFGNLGIYGRIILKMNLKELGYRA
jgi:hypothetical protein